jgi:tol-pal system protein YbgF
MTDHKAMRGLPALIFTLAAWASAGASAQQAAPQPQALTAELQARLDRLEAVQQSSAAYGLLKEVEALKAEVSRLRGQNEMLEHKLESLSKRQSDLYLDLDRRVEDLRKQAKEAAQAQAAPVTSAAAGAAAKGDPLAESKAYEEALDQFKTGNYDKAIAGFADFLKAYPNSTLAANAQYWTGYSHYARKDYKNALEQQTRLVNDYPQSPKVPDALLNIANCQMELNDTVSARKNFQEIVAKYPGTNAAAIAAKRLELLK